MTELLVTLRLGSQLGSRSDRGEEGGGESMHNQMTNNRTSNSDGGVPAGTDATSIHTVCECDNARHMSPVQQQVQNFIVLEADALTI